MSYTGNWRVKDTVTNELLQSPTECLFNFQIQINGIYFWLTTWLRYDTTEEFNVD